MEYRKRKSRVWVLWKLFFPGADMKSCIITWGSVVWLPEKTWSRPLLADPSIATHELVHSRRQSSYGVLRWWFRYWRDLDFRIAEEVEAYRAQWLRQCQLGRVDQKEAYLTDCAIELRGDMYGLKGRVGILEAKNLIKWGDRRGLSYLKLRRYGKVYNL